MWELFKEKKSFEKCDIKTLQQRTAVKQDITQSCFERTSEAHCLILDTVWVGQPASYCRHNHREGQINATEVFTCASAI